MNMKYLMKERYGKHKKLKNQMIKQKVKKKSFIKQSMYIIL